MSDVYFIPVSAAGFDAAAAARKLFETIVEKENITLEKEIPLKVHFGEKGNRSWLKPETYDGIIDVLQERGIQTEFIETSVLYGGERFSREKHTRLALDHGFKRIPIVIADGAHGEEAKEIRIDRKHFRTASIALKLAEAPQVLVLAHFKGHALAGFGGAIKQLSMGFASKGGKMAMHMGVKPQIMGLFCKHCGLCQKRCNEGAISQVGKKLHIDHQKCIGCGACFSICPNHAVSIFSLAGFWNALFRGRFFREKLVEYAYASHTGKRNIYISFALNVTKGCDCEPHPMRACIPDIGVYASTDPVAIDTACWDAAAQFGRRFRGREQLEYAEKIGLGSMKYQIIDVFS